VQKLTNIQREARETLAKKARGEPTKGGDMALANMVEKPAFAACLEAMKAGGEHPKTSALKEILVDHFARSKETGQSTRAMVAGRRRDQFGGFRQHFLARVKRQL